jgi:predicted RNase H-like nuclease (RuvC/YqgF family)
MTDTKTQIADLEAKHAHLEVVLDQSRRHVDDLERQLAEAQKDLRDKFGDQMPDRVNGLRREVDDLELQLAEVQAENERLREAASDVIVCLEKQMPYAKLEALRAALATQPEERERYAD